MEIEMLASRFIAACSIVAASSLAGSIAPTVAETPSRILPEDRGKPLLKCYHVTGLYERAIEISDGEIARRGRWTKLPEGVSAATLRERYDADAIRFVRIYWRGAALGSAYQTDIAVMTRSRDGTPQMRTAILADTAIVPTVSRLCKSAVGWVEQIKDAGVLL
jgi:hypothetical protein